MRTLKDTSRKDLLYHTLIPNTENIYVIEHLKQAQEGVLDIYYNKTNADDWYEVIDFILEDGHDMTGFGLWEIPIEGVYIFLNRLRNEEFVIETKLYDEENTSPVPCYYKTDEKGTFHCAASNIKEAIELNENTHSAPHHAYVGIQDKDGNPLYEGDIVHYGDPNITYTVIWIEKWGRFGTKQNKSYCCLQDLKPWQPVTVKVGSIYENDN